MRGCVFVIMCVCVCACVRGACVCVCVLVDVHVAPASVFDPVPCLAVSDLTSGCVCPPHGA